MRLKITFFGLMFMLFLIPSVKAEEIPELNVDYTQTVYEWFAKIKNDIEPLATEKGFDFVITDFDSTYHRSATVFLFQKERSADFDLRYMTDDVYDYLALYNHSSTSIPYVNCTFYSYSKYENSLSNCSSYLDKNVDSFSKVEPSAYAVNGGRVYSYHIQNKTQSFKPMYISNEEVVLSTENVNLNVTHSDSVVSNVSDVSDLFYVNYLEKQKKNDSSTSSDEILFFTKAIFYLLFCIVIFILFKACMRFLKFLIPF